MEEVLILLMTIIFVSTTFLITATIRQVAQRRFLHRERMLAIEKGLPPTPESLTDAEEERRRRGGPQSTALHGVIWTSIGAGVLVSSYVVGSERLGEDFDQLMAFLRIWAFPSMMVGMGLLIYSYFNRRPKP